jgi:hypothetical protein
LNGDNDDIVDVLLGMTYPNLINSPTDGIADPNTDEDIPLLNENVDKIKVKKKKKVKRKKKLKREGVRTLFGYEDMDLEVSDRKGSRYVNKLRSPGINNNLTTTRKKKKQVSKPNRKSRTPTPEAEGSSAVRETGIEVEMLQMDDDDVESRTVTGLRKRVVGSVKVNSEERREDSSLLPSNTKQTQQKQMKLSKTKVNVIKIKAKSIIKTPQRTINGRNTRSEITTPNSDARPIVGQINIKESNKKPEITTPNSDARLIVR